MTTSTHLRQLPTLQPGDSHSESLIEAAIQGHADTREAMRWLVRQLVPATQPADVMDEQIKAAYLAWCKTNGTPESFARAILALRPERVPMSDEYVQAACGDIFASDHTEPGAYDLAIWRKAETAHGITAQADLWCIHIPGPDEVHAAPSKEAAYHMASKHNTAMATYYASGAPNLEFAPSIENVQAVAIKWPHDQQSHADELREFDWAGWGIKPKEQA